MPVQIMLCCNDYRNGNSTPYAESIELFECELTGRRVRVDYSDKPVDGAKSYEGVASLRVGRLVVPCLSYQTWVGNWCWDAAKIRLIHAVRIWNYLAANPNWHCEGGPCELYDLFNAHGRMEPCTAPELLKRVLFPQGEKP